MKAPFRIPLEFQPVLWTTLRSYDKKTFFSDLTAGLIVGIVALPLAIAFGIASGATPAQGLITAIVGGLIMGLFSGSRVQIGGPTGAFIVILYGIIQQYGYSGLLCASMMAGIIMIIMSLARLGVVIQYIPQPVITGFTSGIALIIFSTQVSDLLGLSGKAPADFTEKWQYYFTRISDTDTTVLITGLVCILFMALWPRLFPGLSSRLPGAFIAVVGSTWAVWFWQMPLETIGSRFGSVPHGIPFPVMPEINWDLIRLTLRPAIAIALLASIESLLSAAVADSMTGTRHRSNMEIMGNGIANIITPFFGGIPVTGAIARTAANIRNGGKTPVAAITHAIVLLLILLILGPLAEKIPFVCLAAILTIVAYNMSEWRIFAGLLKGTRSDVLVLATTFLLTVFFDLVLAIEVGVILAALLFMTRMSRATQITSITHHLNQHHSDDDDISLRHKNVPPGVEVLEIYGPFFFGATHKFEDEILKLPLEVKGVILRMKHVPAIDSSGLKSLQKFAKACRAGKIQFMLTGVNTYPRELIQRFGLTNLIGEGNFYEHIDEALTSMHALLGVSSNPVSTKLGQAEKLAAGRLK